MAALFAFVPVHVAVAAEQSSTYFCRSSLPVLKNNPQSALTAPRDILGTLQRRQGSYREEMTLSELCKTADGDQISGTPHPYSVLMWLINYRQPYRFSRWQVPRLRYTGRDVHSST